MTRRRSGRDLRRRRARKDRLITGAIDIPGETRAAAERRVAADLRAAGYEPVEHVNCRCWTGTWYRMHMIHLTTTEAPGL